LSKIAKMDESDNGMELSLVQTYRMFVKMAHFPHLLKEIRNIFMASLTERGIVSMDNLQQEAIKKITAGGQVVNEENVCEHINVLIDLYFAKYFNDKEIENHINLARKKDALRTLTRVVNMEGVTSLKIKRALRDFCEIPEGQLHITPSEAEGMRVALANHFISNQLPFLGIAKHYITIRDIDEMVEHSYWSPRYPGRIGGKAAGLLLAYRIILPRLQRQDPELAKYISIPKSYYFNSGIFSDFIDYNDLNELHTQKYRSRNIVEDDYKNLPQLIDKTSFQPDIVDEFRGFLKKVGEKPLILRSSSLLEDNFGHAFSGKYDSVFIANQGDLETRLQEFMTGLKRVHMSVCNPAAILYRKERNLLDFDERMSVLVQEVVGRRFGDYFFPFVAGVAFSFNAYCWSARIKKEEGVIRLVFGLGTRAVDRVGKDYPRMIPVGHPLLRPEVEVGQIRKYSQKVVEVLNLRTKHVEAISCLDLMRQIDHPDLYYALSVDQAGDLSAPLFKGQEIDISRSCLTFQNLLTKTPFIGLLKKILNQLEEAYGWPIDMEFAWDNDRLYLLQCRTLAIRKELEKVSLPEDISSDQILFTNTKGVTNSLVRDIEYIVYVDPKAYGDLNTFDEKMAVSHIVNRINKNLERKRYILFGPGRWGSNDINLGVKVGYEDINSTLILGEVAFEEEGFTPDVSNGTHFFNDLVEADIIPIAIYPDQIGVIFNEDFLLQSMNELVSMVPDFASYESVVHVIHVPSCTEGRLLQVYQNGHEQLGIGIFALSDTSKNTFRN